MKITMANSFRVAAQNSSSAKPMAPNIMTTIINIKKTVIHTATLMFSFQYYGYLVSGVHGRRCGLERGSRVVLHTCMTSPQTVSSRGSTMAHWKT